MKKYANWKVAGGILGIILILVLVGASSSSTKTNQPTTNSQTAQPLDRWQTNSTWSGYLKQGQNITAVSGQWTVPHFLYSSDLRGSGTWIGIGGWNSQKLLQIGIVHFENQGVTVPYAFTQRYPLEPQNIQFPNMSISSGDKISASINKLTGSQWRLAITDLTTGQHGTRTVSYDPDQHTAEWIFEWATPNKYKLPVFEKFGFSHLAFSGQAAPLASTDRLKMVQGKNLLVDSSKLGADGMSFDLTYIGQ